MLIFPILEFFKDLRYVDLFVHPNYLGDLLFRKWGFWVGPIFLKKNAYQLIF